MADEARLVARAPTALPHRGGGLRRLSQSLPGPPCHPHFLPRPSLLGGGLPVYIRRSNVISRTLRRGGEANAIDGRAVHGRGRGEEVRDRDMESPQNLRAQAAPRAAPGGVLPDA